MIPSPPVFVIGSPRGKHHAVPADGVRWLRRRIGPASIRRFRLARPSSLRRRARVRSADRFRCGQLHAALTITRREAIDRGISSPALRKDGDHSRAGRAALFPKARSSGVLRTFPESRIRPVALTITSRALPAVATEIFTDDRDDDAEAKLAKAADRGDRDGATPTESQLEALKESPRSRDCRLSERRLLQQRTYPTDIAAKSADQIAEELAKNPRHSAWLVLRETVTAGG